MKIAILKNVSKVNEVVDVHMQSFTGFFLTFLGRGFLKQLYKGFVLYGGSGLIVAINENNKIVGFLAYSDDLSNFYKFLLKKHFIPFAWYAICGFIRNPKILFRLLRAFTYSKEAERDENYIELSSIGVLPEAEGMGIGSKLVCMLKRQTYAQKFAYIKLETDALNNEKVNSFYQKNGFELDHEYETYEGRKMNEYRFYLSKGMVS